MRSLNSVPAHCNLVETTKCGLGLQVTPFAMLRQEARVLFDFDVIVVGGGAGGATFAYACARAGKSVLLLERGTRYVTNGPSPDEKAMMIDKRPYDDREGAVNGRAKRLYMGGVLGGGTSLYGGALVRPSNEDFDP